MTTEKNEEGAGTTAVAEEKPTRDVTKIGQGKPGPGRPTAAILSSDPNIASKTRDSLHGERKKRIVIPSTEREKTDVPVAVNGYTVLIQRDKEVEVPLSIIEALDNSTMTIYDQVKRPDGQEGYDLVPRKVRRFEYRVV